jgi:multiple sugar transport system permease protein
MALRTRPAPVRGVEPVTPTRTTGTPGSSLSYVWATLVPVLALVALFTLFPFAYAAVTSTRRVLLTMPHATPFIGVRNYTDALAEPAFRAALANTALFTAVSVPLVTAAGLAVALLLNQRIRGFGVLRALIILPWAVPLVSAGIMWRLLLHGNFGALNGFLVQIGLIDSYIPWLSRPNLAMLSVLVAHVWREFPLPTIIFLAGLQSIRPETVEAAKVDGAGPWARFRYVVFPQLKAPLLIVLVYQTIMAIAIFDLVYVLTGGGPGSATTLFSWFVYITTFRFLNLGQGAALSLLMALLFLVIIVVYLWRIRPEEEGV